MSVSSTIDALDAVRSQIMSTNAWQRLTKLFDDGAFTQFDTFAGSDNGLAEAVAGRGTINGCPAFAYAQCSDFSGGAMSKTQAAKIKKLYDLALKTGTPVIAIFDSVGGRLSEGCELLGAYGDVLKYVSSLSGVVPQISLVLGSCFGTQALIAVSGDVVIMSEDAKLTINTDGSDASAKKNAENGTAHIVEKTEDDAIAKARQLISLLPANNLDFAGSMEFEDAEEVKDDIVSAVLDGNSAVELQKDNGKAIRTVLGTVEGTTVGVVACQEKILDGKSCSKAARFIRFCDAFGIPVVSLIDAEKFACIKAAAKLTSAYAEATTAKITVITGDAFGAVYIAAAGTGANADITYAWNTASISPLMPEAAAVIALGDDLGGKLKGSTDPKKDRAAVVAEYKKENLSAVRAAEDGFVEDIIAPANTRAAVANAIEILADKRVSTLPKKHNNINI